MLSPKPTDGGCFLMTAIAAAVSGCARRKASITAGSGEIERTDGSDRCRSHNRTDRCATFWHSDTGSVYS